MTKLLKASYTRAKVIIGNLNVDHSYQGPLQKRQVQRLIKSWDDSLAWTSIYVSQRADGTLWILDGQHRVGALVECGFGEYEAEVNLYTGLTLADEARLYHELNTTRSRGFFDRFNAAVLSGSSPEVEIDRLMVECGWKRSRNEGLSCVCSLSAVKTAWHRNGAEALREALTVIGQAWHYAPGSASATLVASLTEVLSGGKAVDRSKLVAKLQRVPGGHVALTSQIKGERLLRGCSMPEAGSDVIGRLMKKNARAT